MEEDTRATKLQEILTAKSKAHSRRKLRHLLHQKYPEPDQVPLNQIIANRNFALLEETLTYIQSKMGRNTPTLLNTSDPLPLSVAIGDLKPFHTKDLKSVKLLIENGASAKTVGAFQPLVQALTRGSIDLIKLLLQHGANPYDTGGEYGLKPIDIVRQVLHQGQMDPPALLYFSMVLCQFKTYRPAAHIKN